MHRMSSYNLMSKGVVERLQRQFHNNHTLYVAAKDVITKLKLCIYVLCVHFFFFLLSTYDLFCHPYMNRP